MEHSRLLKFLTEPRYRTIMAEPPSIKVHRDYEDSPNISAEVPGEQTIRNLESNYQETVDIQEMENGRHKDSYVEMETTVQTAKETDSPTVGTTESKEVTKRLSHNEDKDHDAKKSRIPLSKFKKTVEKVKEERKKKSMKDQPSHKHRRSSIPKLKDAKAVKRRSSLKVGEKLDDEFERLYEEVIDKKQNIVDDKILAVNIDDPEKVESKFEEIIHAYDSNDDNYFTPTEKLKLSKIPWRKKDNAANRTGVLDKKKTTVNNTELKDGGFKVSATTITTKRFSRGNSMDMNKAQKINIVEPISAEDPKETELVTKTVTTEIVVDNPENIQTTIHSINRATSVGETDSVKMVEKIETAQNTKNVETIKIEEFDGGRKITKETITRIPIKPKRLNPSISRDLNRRPPNLDDRDLVNREVLKYEDFKDGTSKTVLRETVIKEPEIRTDKMTRSIRRTFSRDGKSITLSSQSKQSYKETKKQSTESNDLNTLKPPPNQLNDLQYIDHTVMKIEKITTDNTKLPAPVITQTTHSYVKGSIQNVLRSKSVEWKSADEIIPKKYNRAYSENQFTKHEIGDKNANVNEGVVERTKTIIDDVSLTEPQTGIRQSSIIESDIDKNHTMLNIAVKPANVSEVNTASVSRDQENLHISPNNLKSTQETTTALSGSSKALPSQEDVKNNDGITAPILKGNVSRLITQLSVQDKIDMSKKDINVEEELPKKKSVLSKIAMFEGKGEAEHTIEVKKCLLDKKPKSENIEKRTNAADKIYLSQPELDYLNNNVYLPNGNSIDANERRFNDTPVIVDQIWKYQEENISTMQQVQEVRILPQAINFTVSESNAEIIENNPESKETLLTEKSVEPNEDYSDQTRLLPEKLAIIPSEKQIADPKILPDKINFKTSERQSDTAVISDISSKNQVGISKFSLEKNTSIKNDSDNKTQKPKVGKLNLDLWNKQVQNNKQLIAKGKPIEPTQNPIKVQKITTAKLAYEKEAKIEDQSELIILPSEVVYTSDINKDEVPILLPEGVKVKSEVKHTELPIISPIRRDFKPTVNLSETPKLLQEGIDFSTHKGHLQVPVILPETPLTKTTKLKFENQKSQIEVPVPVSYTTEIKTNIYSAETTNITPDTNTSEIPITLSDRTADDHVFETPRLPGKIDIVTDKTGFENPKILPEYINFKTPEQERGIERLATDKISFNSYGKLNQSNETFPKPKNITDKEIPSDPELVDSEPELKDTKDTIMGKLKNKVFLITSRNASKNKATYHTQKSSTQTTRPYVNENSNVLKKNTFSRDNHKSTNDLNITSNRVQSSIHDHELHYDSREDKKRTKSLAELDLGDAVKGQVQRMVYRIKSVDFDRVETPKSRKISLREMPKKSSVLEKIALFEGKANSTTTTNTKHIDIAPATKNLSQPLPQSPDEEMCLRKIEDLSTAKLRYNKTDMLYLSLGNGDQMPAIALGTALLDQRLIPHIVSAAIDLGYRAIDTAFIYGTEQLVGEGIKKKIADGTVSREDLFIMGKLWSTFHKPELVESACRASLEALGLEYFDLYMIHNPMSLKEGGDPVPQIANVLQFSEYDYLDAWFAMEALVSKGLVKMIGVSNFNSQQIQKILDKGHIKPVVNQVECHTYMTQQPLDTFCKERNITLSCFSVLGSKGTPADYKTGVPAAIDDPLVRTMASGLNVTPAQLLVRYQIQSGRQAVVKASTPGHLYDILQALTFVLEPNQIAALNALNRNQRNFDLKMFGELHKNYPFNVPF